MANFLTVFRVILAFFTLGLLFTDKPSLYISAFFLTIIVIALDGLDGYVARKFNETSKLGSVIDILGDRIVENAYWVVFAVLGWVGAWLPIVVLTRGIITDGIRSIAFSEGYTAFGDTSMNKSKIGNFITASRFSRAVYGTAKALAFVLMILAYVPKIEEFKPMTVESFYFYLTHVTYLKYFAHGLAYIAVAFCVIRALPVIWESKQFFVKNEQ